MKKVKKSSKRVPRWVAVSGGFDPLHIGHVRMFKAARKLGDKLVVILNNDNWLKSKKGFVFMPQKERMEIIKEFPFVDRVVLTSHKSDDPQDAYHRSVSRDLKRLKPAVFANGGDRDKKNAEDPNSSLYCDIQTCRELGIKMVYNVGRGGKVQSSSWMIKDAVKGIARSVRPWGEFYGWDSGDTWYVKTLRVLPSKRLSLQYHHKRSERWVLVEGEATAITVQNGKTIETPLTVGETFLVHQGMPHRLTSHKGGLLVEVAIGSSFDENDIVRLEDDYGRHEKK
jgi:D-beta-D-heptose 7-phosphate kinase/D-beta-D-heptose 1-phosphate adenosyltransferase